MSLTRRGALATAAGVILALSALPLAAIVSAQASARYREVSARAQKIQGREWCLGAAALPKGQRIESGSWTIAHEADGDRVAQGPGGTYRIASDGRERWSRSQP